MTDIEYLKKYYDGDLDRAFERLSEGEPVQYIIGNVDFCGNRINVNKNVLIPRFETEELVEHTIKYIKKYFKEKIKVLDIGTGSGCIIISLKKEIPLIDAVAVDISNEALDVAKKNALLNNVEINFIHSNIFSNLNEKFDVIISNPPYISYDEEIMDIVKKNEPSIALYASKDGLYYYEEILKSASKYLNKKYLICFEIGMNQFEAIDNIRKKYLSESKIELKKDMQNRDRIVFIYNFE